MKKIIKLVGVIMIGLLVLTGCQKIDKEAASKFKKEYEALNGKTNSAGKEHRTVNISSKNPFVKLLLLGLGAIIVLGVIYYVMTFMASR